MILILQQQQVWRVFQVLDTHRLLPDLSLNWSVSVALLSLLHLPPYLSMSGQMAAPCGSSTHSLLIIDIKMTVEAVIETVGVFVVCERLGARGQRPRLMSGQKEAEGVTSPTPKVAVGVCAPLTCCCTRTRRDPDGPVRSAVHMLPDSSSDGSSEMNSVGSS